MYGKLIAERKCNDNAQKKSCDIECEEMFPDHTAVCIKNNRDGQGSGQRGRQAGTKKSGEGTEKESPSDQIVEKRGKEYELHMLPD